jgi:hypothetical protein
MRFARDGRMVFAREATLMISQGRLAAAPGVFVMPSILISGAPTRIRVSRDGTVLVTQDSTESKVGTLSLALFSPNAGLQPVGEFWVSPERPRLAAADSNGSGWFSTPTTPTREPSPPGRASTEGAASNGRQRPPTPQNTRVQIQIRQESMVEHASFTLGDVADVISLGENSDRARAIVLGDTPPVGIKRRIDRERVLLRLRMAGIDPTALSIVIPPDANVQRPSQVIPHEKFVEAAQQALTEVVGAEAQITDLNPMPPMTLGVGDVSFVTKSPSISGTRASVVVEVRVGDQKVNSRTVQLGVSGRIPLPKVGSMVTLRARVNGVRVQQTVKVVRTSGLNQVEVETAEGTRLSGRLVEAGVIEVIL